MADEVMTAECLRLPNGWESARLGEVVDILDSRRVPINAEERSKRLGNVPYYGATGQVGWIDDYLFDEELVLLGEDGAPFLDSARSKAYVVRGKTWVNNHAHVLRGAPGILNLFIMYQLNQIEYRPFVSGTTRLKLPQAPMREIPLKIAPTEEQRRIVAAIETQLTRLDAAVAALERARANLKRYRAAVLKAACEGRLVPTEAEVARAEGRGYEAASVLLERIAAERDSAGRHGRAPLHTPDELPNLPEGWCWVSVQQLAIVVQYGTSAKTTENAEGVPVLRMGNISDGRLIFDSLKHLPTNHEEFPKLLLTPGDLLFNRTNSAELVGKSAIYKGYPTPCSFASYLIRVELGSAVLSDYLAYLINSAYGRQWIRSVVNQQVGQANVNGSKLQSLPVPLPPLAEQHRIVAEVERRLSVVEEMEGAIGANLRRAERVRQGVLRRAFAGELVGQDPTDEPARVLLERIRGERATSGVAVRSGWGKGRTVGMARLFDE